MGQNLKTLTERYAILRGALRAVEEAPEAIDASDFDADFGEIRSAIRTASSVRPASA